MLLYLAVTVYQSLTAMTAARLQLAAHSSSSSQHLLDLLAAQVALHMRHHFLQKCRRCELEKPAAEFYRNRLMLDGLYSHCKACYQASAAQRVADRPPLDSEPCRRYAPDLMLKCHCKACYQASAAQRVADRSPLDSKLCRRFAPVFFSQLSEHLVARHVPAKGTHLS